MPWLTRMYWIWRAAVPYREVLNADGEDSNDVLQLQFAVDEDTDGKVGVEPRFLHRPYFDDAETAAIGDGGAGHAGEDHAGEDVDVAKAAGDVSDQAAGEMGTAGFPGKRRRDRRLFCFLKQDGAGDLQLSQKHNRRRVNMFYFFRKAPTAGSPPSEASRRIQKNVFALDNHFTPAKNFCTPFYGIFWKNSGQKPINYRSLSPNSFLAALSVDSKTKAILETLLFRCPTIRAAAFLIAAALLVGAPLFAADGEAAPLPPPPELLDEIDYGFSSQPVPVDQLPYEMQSPAASAEDLHRALAPLTVQPAAPQSSATQHVEPPALWGSDPLTVPVPVAASVQVTPPPARQTFTISPPSRFMPADYFNLPMIDEGIPGVLLPEPDENFYDPAFAALPAAPAGRPVERGMSIRQLEPFFALAKGSEGAALDARTRGEESAYRDQLSKAIDAYMAIIEMADAGHEAREEAWYGVARCEYRRENWWRAFDALERSFPEQYEHAEVAGRIKLEMYIGERLWRMAEEQVPDAVVDGRRLNGRQAASRVYAAAVFNQPAAEDAPLALLRRGDAAALEGEWKEAAKFYRQVVEYFPESDSAMQARSSLTEAVYRQDWPAGFPEAARVDVASIMDDVERADARLSEDAEERRRRAVALANDLEAENRLRQAKAYLNNMRLRKSRDAAVFLLGDVVSRYPTTPQAEEAAEILRGMGIEPPMRLSDGDRFPLTAGWSGRESGREREMEKTGDMGGGFIRLEGQDDEGEYAFPSSLPFSPTRETIYEPFPEPAFEPVPGVAP